MALASEDDMTQIDQMEIEPQSEVMDETLLNNDVSSTAESVTQFICTSDKTPDSLDHQMLSDSESGESLFITQSVSGAVRTLKRQRAARSESFSESDSEDERDRRRCPEDGHLQNEEGHSGRKTYWSFRKQKRRFRSNSKKLAFPFLLNSHGQQYLPREKQHHLENSEIGGFFKWIKRIQMDFLYYHPPKYLEDFLVTDDFEEEEQNSDQEVTVVNPVLFASCASPRNRQKWCSKSILERRIQDAHVNKQTQRTLDSYDQFKRKTTRRRRRRRIQKSCLYVVNKTKNKKGIRQTSIQEYISDTDEEEDDEVQPASGPVEVESDVPSSVSKSDEETDAHPSFELGTDRKIEISQEYISHTDEEEDDEVQPASGPVEVESDVPSSVSNSDEETDAHPLFELGTDGKIKIFSQEYISHTDEEEDDVVQPASGPVEVESDVLSSVSKSDDNADAIPLFKRVRKGINRKKKKKSREYISDTDEEEDDEVQPASGPVQVESDVPSSVSNSDDETDAHPSFELGTDRKIVISQEHISHTDEEEDDEVQPASGPVEVESDVPSSVSNSDDETDAHPSFELGTDRKIVISQEHISHTDEEEDDEVQPASGPVEVESDVPSSVSKSDDNADATPLFKRVRKGINRKKIIKSREYISDTDEEEDDEVQPASGPDEVESDVPSSVSNSDDETDAHPSFELGTGRKIEISQEYISHTDEEENDEVQPASGPDEVESDVPSSVSNSDDETDAHPSFELGTGRKIEISQEYISHTDEEEDDEVQPASGPVEVESDVLSSVSKNDEETDAHPSFELGTGRKIEISQEYISHTDEEEDDEVQPASGPVEVESDVLSSVSKNDEETDAHPSFELGTDRKIEISEKDDDEVQPASGPDETDVGTRSDKCESCEMEDESTSEEQILVSQSPATANRLSSACDADDTAGLHTTDKDKSESGDQVEEDTGNKEQVEESGSAEVKPFAYRLRSRNK